MAETSEPILLRAVVSKSLIKATILIAVFSLFLELSPAKIAAYAIFLAFCYGLFGVYAFSKWSTLQMVTEGGIVVKPFLRPERRTKYSEIADLSYSQGVLARRFDCGTVFILLNVPGGKARLFGGGSAELLRDVKDPEKVVEEISSRLSPYSNFGGSAEDLR